jgi:HEAT repeat protein
MFHPSTCGRLNNFGFPPDENDQPDETASFFPKLDVDFRGRVIEALLRQNQPEALLPAVEYLKSNVPTETTHSIESSINLVSDPAALPELVNLLSHSRARQGFSYHSSQHLDENLKYPPSVQVKVDIPRRHHRARRKQQLTPDIGPSCSSVDSLFDADTQVRFQAMLALTEITSAGERPRLRSLGERLQAFR